MGRGGRSRVTALVAGHLIDGSGGAVIEDATVAIRGDRVAAVGSGTEVAVPSGAGVTTIRDLWGPRRFDVVARWQGQDQRRPGRVAGESVPIPSGSSSAGFVDERRCVIVIADPRRLCFCCPSTLSSTFGLPNGCLGSPWSSRKLPVSLAPVL